MARSFLRVCRNPGAPVIICGAVAHIRLNYQRWGLSAEIAAGLEGGKGKHVFSLSLHPHLSLLVCDTHTHTLGV